ncbi:uncharacterized protein A1O9_06927 [Exophiala aquamarina CBS 119918]|uniref:Gluconate 5-dehydrogenase n=1 Tax=Exophiala aquamarina CBS 119918 TaxID=1182545 RepID=A0A072PAG3_9EURO|nr:uncharacterized protein A1O9_06927 [Exophiala aquamarina CBS 119918]KEF56737.1 hypothetical protein A1O9_06927 [Exophiala aquamarina CBS 119918]
MSQLNNFDGLFRLDGKVALITGGLKAPKGSRGLGLHTATAFLRAGAAHVLLAARKLEGEHGLTAALTALKQEIPGCETKVTIIASDLSRVSEVQTLVETVQSRVSKVDILIANAGATWGGPLATTPDESIGKVLDLNVRSIINLVRVMSPLLEKSATPTDPSRIIIVGAIAGFTVPFTGENSTIVYSVSKAAAHHLARNLAVELGPRNITTNCIAPGFFPSKLSRGIIGIMGGIDNMKAANPVGRIGMPEDIAGAMLYLCSQAGSFVNGIILPLDGGNYLQSGLFTKL